MQILYVQYLFTSVSLHGFEISEQEVMNVAESLYCAYMCNLLNVSYLHL